MTINYPQSLDSDENLYLVHDSLRTRLVEDYTIGDTIITVEDNSAFPPTGIITLTEQCSDISLRGISFSYSSKGTGTDTFEGLELLDGFIDNSKAKRITNVTLNVVDKHHNQLKDSLIAIENFVGKKGEVSLVPVVGTMEERVNFLRNLVFKPKAWFAVNKQLGIYPLCIDFEDYSTREPDTWVWDFGDGDVVTVNRSSTITRGSVTKCYDIPGIYSVKLTVTNDFGTDEIIFTDFITVRVDAPDEATIDFIPSATQTYSGGVLRSRINKLISILVDDNGQKPLDPIIKYTWSLQDDLTHDSSDQANASYSVGGLYDVKLTTETELGAFRITSFPETIDIIEKYNLFHFIFDPLASDTAVTKTLYAYEFGLLSETYKSANVSSALSVTRDAGFLTGVTNYDQQYKEFRRNNGFSQKTLVASGDKGNSIAYWAEGGSSSDSNVIRFREFNAFSNTWSTPILGNSLDYITNSWNWLSLTSDSNIYFLYGLDNTVGSLTNQEFQSLSLSNYSLNTINFTSSNYLNGANELMSNVGGGVGGDFSVYRGTWKDSTGYFVRNDGINSYFRLKSFYRTEGTVSSPLQNIRKLTDMPGNPKLEGQLISLSKGLYFFNNTGEFLFYDTVANVWSVGGPGVSSIEFQQFQDTSVSGYDDDDNTLVAVSDQSTNAYLFFDYSIKAQMKFNEISKTFTSLPSRPRGEQFVAGLY